MSVTFSIEGNPTGLYTWTCYAHGEFTSEPMQQAEAAYDRDAHTAGCEDCAAYGSYLNTVLDVPAHLDVNLANANARLVLTLLGLPTTSEEGLVGSVDGTDLLGRVLLAMAADRDDTGVRAVEVPGPGARMVDCGLPAGYYAARFAALHALATEAARLGRPVQWA